MQEKSQTWSIAIIGYNESENIAGVIESTLDVLSRISPEKSELIIVDDGSKDNSWEIIQSYASKHSNIKAFRHEVNQGIGAALRTSYNNATCENVGVIPADGQLDIFELLPHSIVPQKSILSFFRKENTEYNFFRNYLSWFNKILNRIFLGLNMKDVNWLTIYKTRYLEKLDLQVKSSLIETEICCKLAYLGCTIHEVKSKYLPREKGKSKGGSFKIVLQAISEIIRLIRIFNAYKRKVKRENIHLD